MAREFARAFYKSEAWNKTRQAYARSVGGLCERCFNRGDITPGVIVHHIKPITADNINDPRVTLSFDNLELVCRQCHADEHEDLYAKSRGRRYTVDDSGNVRAL